MTYRDYGVVRSGWTVNTVLAIHRKQAELVRWKEASLVRLRLKNKLGRSRVSVPCLVEGEMTIGLLMWELHSLVVCIVEAQAKKGFKGVVVLVVIDYQTQTTLF